MPAVIVDQLNVRYPGRKVSALDAVSVAVEAGQIVSVAGRTGAGKSTLCLAVAGLLPRVVRASVSGRVLVGDVDVTRSTQSGTAGRAGIVFSSPGLQLSSSKPNVREELAFGLENLAVPRDDMDERIDRVMGRLGIDHLADRDPLTLSGGEQQRVAIASIVVMGTDVLVLDEPAAQLDPLGTDEIAGLLRELANDGRAVLVAEHSAEILAVSDRCIVLESGRVVSTGLPGAALADSVVAAGTGPPTLVVLAMAGGVPPAEAFNEEAVARALAGAGSRAAYREAATSTRVERATGSGAAFVRDVTPATLEIRGLVHRYPGGVEALRGVDLTVQPGSTVAIVGQNGSGKTTLVKHLNGLLRPDAGHVALDGQDISARLVSDLAGQIGFVFQNPDDQLFNSRVDREVGFGPRNLGLEPSRIVRLVENALGLTGLEGERATNPYDLDISVRKLVALAGVLAMEPSVLVLDEPTMSQDRAGTRRVGSIVDAWAGAGRTVIAITHDMEFAARHFARIVVMREGVIVLDEPPSQAFAAQNAALLETTGLKPPPAARVASHMGLGGAPADADALLEMLAARYQHTLVRSEGYSDEANTS